MVVYIYYINNKENSTCKYKLKSDGVIEKLNVCCIETLTYMYEYIIYV